MSEQRYITLEENAIRFATEKHQHQKYNGGQSYTVHLKQVRDILCEHGYVDEYSVAGWLHDVIEDGGVSLEDLTWQFGKEVSDLVWAVTGIGNNRKARNQDQYDKLKAYPKAIILKQADRLANGQISAQDPDGSHFKMYKKEYPAFRAELIISGGDTFMWVRLDKLFGYIQ